MILKTSGWKDVEYLVNRHIHLSDHLICFQYYLILCVLKNNVLLIYILTVQLIIY